jgi:hypothetical protein
MIPFPGSLVCPNEGVPEMLRLEECHFCLAEPLYNGSVATQLTGAFGYSTHDPLPHLS